MRQPVETACCAALRRAVGWRRGVGGALAYPTRRAALRVFGAGARCRWPDAVVEEIRQRVAAGETVTAAAARFGVPFGTAWDFVRCRRRAVLPAGWVTVRAGRRVSVG